MYRCISATAFSCSFSEGVRIAERHDGESISGVRIDRLHGSSGWRRRGSWSPLEEVALEEIDFLLVGIEGGKRIGRAHGRPGIKVEPGIPHPDEELLAAAPWPTPKAVSLPIARPSHPLFLKIGNQGSQAAPCHRKRGIQPAGSARRILRPPGNRISPHALRRPCRSGCASPDDVLSVRSPCCTRRGPAPRGGQGKRSRGFTATVPRGASAAFSGDGVGFSLRKGFWPRSRNR